MHPYRTINIYDEGHKSEPFGKTFIKRRVEFEYEGEPERGPTDKTFQDRYKKELCDQAIAVLGWSSIPIEVPKNPTMEEHMRGHLEIEVEPSIGSVTVTMVRPWND